MNQRKKTKTSLTRRGVLTGAAAMGISTVVRAQQPAEVKVGLIVPLSGIYTRPGQVMRMGAEMGIEHINARGGIKSLGGAKLKLVVIDCGDTTEKAKNAAQRMVAQETDLVAATGAYLSSFTLAVTEVTERAELPVLTLSYSDLITGRGYKYVFQTSPTGGAQAQGALPALLDMAKAGTGQPLKTVGIVMDNTAAPMSFVKPMREGGFQKLNLSLVIDEVFTPPLADATSVVQKVRNTRPDVLLLLPTSVPDDKLVLEKLSEMGLGRGRLPVVSNGAHIGAPEMLRLVGKDLMEGVMTVVANWGARGQEELIAEFKKRTGEPWMTQDSISTYGDMWIFKDALEKAGSADRKKVAEAIRGSPRPPSCGR